MGSTILFLTLFLIIDPTKSWEFCKPDIKSQVCADKGGTHIVCDSLAAIPEVTYKAEKFLAHVPLTRLVKECFIKWHNYYRHRVAGGKAKNTGNSKNFPKASRMRELIWDRELAFISHNRTKLVVMGKDTCHATQRFPHAGQNIAVRVMNENIPVLEVITESIKYWFNEKDNVDDPEKMAKGEKSASTESSHPVSDQKKDETTKTVEGADNTKTTESTTESNKGAESEADKDKANSADPAATETASEKAPEEEKKEEGTEEEKKEEVTEAAKKFISYLMDGEDEATTTADSENTTTEPAKEGDDSTTQSSDTDTTVSSDAATTGSSDAATTGSSDAATTVGSDAAKTETAATTAKPADAGNKSTSEKKSTTTEYFMTMVSERVSRLGCAVALGANCVDSASVTHRFCYYVACTYDFDNTGLIYTTTTSEPASECSHWDVGASKMFKNLCENSGKIFDK